MCPGFSFKFKELQRINQLLDWTKPKQQVSDGWILNRPLEISVRYLNRHFEKHLRIEHFRDFWLASLIPWPIVKAFLLYLLFSDINILDENLISTGRIDDLEDFLGLTNNHGENK